MALPDPTLDDLVLHTRWPVHRTPSGYRLRFDYTDLVAGRIEGIDYHYDGRPDGQYCPRMRGGNFDNIPIIFEMIQADHYDPSLISEFHYYTLNGALHRGQDQPAKFVFVPLDHLTVTMSYCRHGQLHRDSGPALIRLHHVEVSPIRDLNGYEVPHLIQISAESGNLEWFRDGAETCYPHPSSARIEKMISIYDDQRRYQDYGETPALRIASANWSWSSRRISEDYNSDLIPLEIIIDNLTESYQEGKFITRSGTFRETAFYRNQKSGVIPAFPPNYLIDRINLWQAPFALPSTKLHLEAAYDDWKSKQ